MFIREIAKQNKGYEQTFIYHALMESYRTEKGPRHRMILSLGKLELPRDKWKALANRIEEIISNQRSILPVDEEIEPLAQHYGSLIIDKELEKEEKIPPEEADYEEVDINSLENRKCRTIGSEAVSLAMIRKLGIHKIFDELGFSNKQTKIARLLIAGRMVHPASEWQTYNWAKDISAICELLSLNLNKVSHNQFYKVSDILIKHQKEIESRLALNEKNIFSLNDTIILYDLTNTYFESDIGKSKKKRYGRSKEKRDDCPVVTIGLVLTESGFPKRSKIFEGNVAEVDTLMDMIKQLDTDESPEKKTVIIDAGISSEDNLKKLKDSGYDYICVARNKPVASAPQEGFVTIRHTKENKVEAKMIKQEKEIILYCKSLKKKLKEEAMKTKFQERFETDLKAASDSLHKKKGTKNYEKVIERIGRIKQKHSRISHFYHIEIEKQSDKAVNIRWKLKSEPKVDERFSGTYYLRTSRTDLTEEEIWSLYILLTDVEDSFRSMKSELGLRPNYHQRDKRIEGHIFITVLAYHIINSIQWYLHRKDIHLRWDTIRTLLSTQNRVTTKMNKKDGGLIIIRNTSEPEPFHKKITKSLSIESKPFNKRILKLYML